VGVERSVTRWYAQRQVILDEIAALQANLINLQNQQAQQPATGQLSGEAATDAGTTANAASIADIESKLAEAQSRLLALGPCPKSMMG
jgi:hypothetical protein